MAWCRTYQHSFMRPNTEHRLKTKINSESELSSCLLQELTASGSCQLLFKQAHLLISPASVLLTCVLQIIERSATQEASTSNEVREIYISETAWIGTQSPWSDLYVRCRMKSPCCNTILHLPTLSAQILLTHCCYHQLKPPTVPYSMQHASIYHRTMNCSQLRNLSNPLLHKHPRF